MAILAHKSFIFQINSVILPNRGEKIYYQIKVSWIKIMFFYINRTHQNVHMKNHKILWNLSTITIVNWREASGSGRCNRYDGLKSQCHSNYNWRLFYHSLRNETLIAISVFHQFNVIHLHWPLFYGRNKREFAVTQSITWF